MCVVQPAPYRGYAAASRREYPRTTPGLAAGGATRTTVECAAVAVMFGPYRVCEALGIGGMATVHRAETQGIAGFSKQVALKPRIHTSEPRTSAAQQLA